MFDIEIRLNETKHLVELECPPPASRTLNVVAEKP